MNIKKIILSILICTQIFSSTAFAKHQEYKLQLYFRPSVMNDVTGEIVTDINLKNVDLAVPKEKGNICGFEFEYEYDDDIFDILTDDNGNVVITTDENTLIKNSSEISAVAVDGKVHISCTDNDNLIKYDGTICRFTLIAKNVSKLWNSFDSYPIRFVENTILVNTRNENIESYYELEGIDGKIGAYNKSLNLQTVSVNKNIVLFLEKSDMLVNGKVVQTDAEPFVKDEMCMIPMRYFAENIGMDVEWNTEKAMACAYGENKTLKVCAEDNRAYINSALCVQEVNPILINGRIYIPLSLVKELYSNVSINMENDKISIYIP